MKRFFNTTGPCDPRWHYMLPPEARLPELDHLVEQQQYFVIHAPRQTGKTTAMRAFAARLRGKGMVAVYATLEESQGFDTPEGAEPIWLAALSSEARWQLGEALRPPAQEGALAQAVGTRLGTWLVDWCAKLEGQRLVLLLDEADVMRGPALVSLLRQLRAGFPRRPENFPSSIALIGMGDLRDYLTEAKDGVPTNPGSPFNVKRASLTLRNFTVEEVAALYDQHTAETGQIFLPEAVTRAFDWTQGQPFLVNALAQGAVEELVPDPTVAITAADIDVAKERLILSRTTHLDSLGRRLRDARVAPIVAAVLSGDGTIDYDHDDFQYVVDLGLIRRGRGGAEAANPLYREVLARQLSYNVQENLPLPWWRWQTTDGRLDFPALVSAFLEWWRENADALVEDVPLYPEAIPHIAFMGFLQRVVNGGGTVTREYAAGRRALDLHVSYGPDRFVVEIKRVRPKDKLETIKKAAIQQTCAYLDLVGLQGAWVLIFDQRPGLSWEQRLWSETLDIDGKRLLLRGA